MKTNQYGINAKAVIIDISGSRPACGKTSAASTILDALDKVGRTAILVQTRKGLEEFANADLDFIICDIEDGH